MRALIEGECPARFHDHAEGEEEDDKQCNHPELYDSSPSRVTCGNYLIIADTSFTFDQGKNVPRLPAPGTGWKACDHSFIGASIPSRSAVMGESDYRLSPARDGTRAG